MKLRDRMAGIDVNLDDLQSGIEACSRAADVLESDSTKFNGFLHAPLLRAVLRHLKELQACTHDQRGAMQELRDGIARLRDELKQSSGAVRPPRVAVAEGQSR